jgi:hypothetical protein
LDSEVKAPPVAPFLRQTSGLTILENYKRSDLIPKDLGFKISSHSLFEITGGNLEIRGLSHDWMIKFSNLIQIENTGSSMLSNSNPSNPLFLNAQIGTSSPVNPIESISISYTFFEECEYNNPSGGLKMGGLIRVVGSSSNPIELILDNVKFETITYFPSTCTSGVVNGGIIYGEYLKSVRITSCIFIGGKVCLGHGGALYLKNVSGYVNGSGLSI